MDWISHIRRGQIPVSYTHLIKDSYPDIDIVTIRSFGEISNAYQVARDVITANPEIEAMYVFSMAEDDEFLSTMRSVEQDGFLEDIVVTPDGENTWRIICGHRRVMAARKLGKTAVPCKVRRYPDKLSELRALMGANVHRRSLSPFDMARQLETLREVLSESGQLPEGTKEQAELMAAQSDPVSYTHLDVYKRQASFR